jgi:hypothetical protein
VGQAVDETKRQLELTRAEIAGHLDRVERRIRSELDWKARLRRDGPQIVVVLGGVAVVATAAIVLRRRFSGGRQAVEEAAHVDELRRVSLRDLAVEIRDLRAEVEKLRDGKAKKDGAPLWARLVLGVAGSAASAGGRAAAKRLIEQQHAEREASTPR